MKFKIILSTLAVLVCATFAFAEEKYVTISEDGLFRYNPCRYADGSTGVVEDPYKKIVLGNYVDSGVPPCYVYAYLLEIPTAGFEFNQIDAINFLASTPGVAPDRKRIDLNLKAFSISYYSGGTGDCKSDFEGGGLSLIGKIDNLSYADMMPNSYDESAIWLKDLKWNISSEEYITFVVTIDEGVVAADIESGEASMIRFGPYSELSILGSTATVPEPSTYAAILGALAMGFAIYRRRK